jgi:RimJ/RimL family protein N-acetyltransferase
MDLRLRPADRGDLYSLWLWANDPATRAASFGRPLIEWDEHLAWFASQEGRGAHVLMAEMPDGRPVGSIRFESSDGWLTARVSYVVAPEARGQGWSRPLVERGVSWLAASHPSTALVARVAADNARSLRVFRGAGWSETVAAGEHLFHHTPESRRS